MYTLTCARCPRDLDESTYRSACPACRGPLEFRYAADAWAAPREGASLWKYRSLLPVRPDARIVTLGEGGTPLLRVRFPGGAEVHVKNEAVNPTGSHKDRAISVGITQAVAFGFRTAVVFSDGSTALSAAAYAARAGLKSVVVFGRGAADHRLLPLMVYGARLLEYQGSPDEAVGWVYDSCRRLGLYETSTYRLANPYQAEAQRTLGFEIFDQLGRVPDWIVLPAGGGGTLAGIARAFDELVRAGLASRRPRLAGVTPLGCTALENALKKGVRTDEELRTVLPRDVPDTVQVKTALAYPPDGVEAVAAVRASGGVFLAASDAEALAAQRRFASSEGLYAEPSSAAALVGVEKLLAAGLARPEDTIVAVVTGSGFRETGTLSGRVPLEKIPVPAGSGPGALERLLEG
jgi:threonine synthase